MEHESVGKIYYDYTIEAAASSQNSFAGESRSKSQPLPELILAKK